MTALRIARIVAASLVTVATALLFGCGSGYSTEDAESRCTQEQTARAGGACFDDTLYDDCVAAYEECGDDVTVGESCPPVFTCPE